MAIAPDALARKVLPRVLCVLAARAQFTTDRISDTELVADALVSEAFASSTGNHLNVAVTVEPRSLAVRVGPLDSGSAERVIASSPGDGVGPVIEKLTDDRRVAMRGPVGDARAAPARPTLTAARGQKIGGDRRG